MKIDQTRRRRWPSSWWMWVTYWVLLLIVMHIPSGAFLKAPVRNADKFTHFVCYFLLVWLGGRYQLSRGPVISKITLLGWLLVYTMYAGLDEWTQQFVGRHTSFADWVCDVAAIITATVILAVRPGLAKLSVPEL